MVFTLSSASFTLNTNLASFSTFGLGGEVVVIATTAAIGELLTDSFLLIKVVPIHIIVT